MNARLALNLGLIGLLGILVLLAVYEPGLEPPKPLPPLTTLAGTAVKGITIERKDAEPVRLLREGERWLMQAPYAVPANRGRVEAMLRFVAGASQASFPAAGQALERFGLADPGVRLAVDGEVFAFGDINPLDHQRYVLYRDRVHLTVDGLYDDLTADPGDFVSPRLVEDGRELVAIELPAANIERRDYVWVLEPPDSAIKDADLARLAEDWRSAQALTVRKRREAKPEGTVTLRGKEAPGQPTPSIRFEVLAREPELVLARPDLGIEYRLGGEMAGRLLAPNPVKTEDATTGQGQPAGPP
jgi:hypothetical protein